MFCSSCPLKGHRISLHTEVHTKMSHS